MPGPNDAAITLAAVQKTIIAQRDLLSSTRTELHSAINRFAVICGRTPADIPADPAILRGLAKRAPWQLAGLAKKSWANVLSRLRKAMQLAGVEVHRQRRNFKLDAAWQALLAPMCRRDHDELHRFAGWCSTLGIAPLDVTPDTFDRFLTYLDEQMIQKNPRERGHVARRAWNRMVAAHPGSSYPAIPAPEPPGERLLRWSDFSSSLRQEVKAYRQRMLLADPFDAQHRPIRPVTLENYLGRLQVYLTVLVKSGLLVEQFASMATLVDAQTVKRSLELRLAGRELDSRLRQDLSTIMVALLSVAKFVGVDAAHYKELQRFAKIVRHRANGMTAKNKERLAPLASFETQRRLISLPVEIGRKLGKVAAPTVRDAQQMQMACLLDFLLHVPLRIKNVAELDLEKHIIRPLGGKAGPWRVSIAAESVKNKVAIEAVLSEDLSALLDLYVRKFRPVLTDQKPVTKLFVSQGGGAKGSHALSRQFSGFVRRELGLTINAHLMRHLAALLYLAEHPGCYEDVRRMLGHKSIATTINSYTGTETADAIARYTKLISNLRKGRTTSTKQLALARDEEEAA